MTEMGRFASFAYVIGGLGNVAAGYVSGRLIRAGIQVDRSRKLAFVVGAILCTGSTAMVTVTKSIFTADLLAGIAIFGVSAMSCMLLAVMSDTFPQSALARVGGLTGVGEGIVNMTLTLGTGIILDRFSFGDVFAGATVLPVLSVVSLYTLVRPLVNVRRQLL